MNFTDAHRKGLISAGEDELQFVSSMVNSWREGEFTLVDLKGSSRRMIL